MAAPGNTRFEMDDFLITLQQHPHIYDLENGNHKNKRMVDQSWEAVAAAFNISVKEAKSKWRNVRDSFKKEKKTHDQKSSGSAYAPPPKWRYYDVILNMLASKHHPIRVVGNMDTGLSEQEAGRAPGTANIIETSQMQSEDMDDYDDEWHHEIIEVHPGSATTSPNPITQLNKNGESVPVFPTPADTSSSSSSMPGSLSFDLANPMSSQSNSCSATPAQNTRQLQRGLLSTPSTSRTPQAHVRKRKLDGQIGSAVDRMSESLRDVGAMIHERRAQTVEPDDIKDTTHFYCISVAKRLRALSKELEGAIKIKLETMLFNAEIHGEFP